MLTSRALSIAPTSPPRCGSTVGDTVGLGVGDTDAADGPGDPPEQPASTAAAQPAGTVPPGMAGGHGGRQTGGDRPASSVARGPRCSVSDRRSVSRNCAAGPVVPSVAAD